MKIIRWNLILIVLGMFGMSCSQDNQESPIIVNLKPVDIQLEASSGDLLFITVEARTNQGSEILLNIESLDDQYGILSLLDTSFSFRSINFRYAYRVPDYEDSTEVTMIFSLANDVNDQIQVAKKILVNKGSKFIEETTGHNMFSTLSDKPNGFSLAELSTGYTTDSATFEADIYDGSVVEDDGDTLSRVWMSQSDIGFVQFNGFDFASATASSISSAYKNGLSVSKAIEIKDNDIYIVGRGSTALAAIQVITVVDQSGVNNDKYTFSVKSIQTN
ncbi:hypothetical protein [Marinoscillum sp. MHG1-6]|uniref:hypothetical protein n=1 Tax=Marinoscillum sp. MHG1-6 TaxID=2959627 RepID=UPI0021587366|nr:hypothetical protein [Marinoscillum sp. MHG1-6]